MFGIRSDLSEKRRIFRVVINDIVPLEPAYRKGLLSRYPYYRLGHYRADLSSVGPERAAYRFASQVMTDWLDSLPRDLRETIAEDFPRAPRRLIEDMFSIQKSLGVSAVAPPGMSQGSFVLAMSLEAVNSLAGEGKLTKDEVIRYLGDVTWALMGHDQSARMKFRILDEVKRLYPRIDDPDDGENVDERAGND